MDPDIALWTVEFLLTQNISDNSLNKLLMSIPPASLSSNNNHLKLTKLLLLRTIQTQLSHNRITEDILEQLEQLDSLEGSRTLDSMKAAYVAVAVECTVKWLEGNEVNDGFRGAVERVWKGRVRVMEEFGRCGLWSDELGVWRRLMEGSVDPDGDGLCGEVLRWDGSRARSVVRGYLDEAMRVMGMSFLELTGKAVEMRMEKGASVRLAGLVEIMRMLKMRRDAVGGRGGLAEQIEDERLEVVRDKGDDDIERKCAPESGGKSVDAFGETGEDKDGSSSNVGQDRGLRESFTREGGIIQEANVRLKHNSKGVQITPTQDESVGTSQTDEANLQDETEGTAQSDEAGLQDKTAGTTHFGEANVPDETEGTAQTDDVNLQDDTEGTALADEADLQGKTEGTSCTNEANLQDETKITAQTGEGNLQDKTKITAQTVEADLQDKIEGLTHNDEANLPDETEGTAQNDEANIPVRTDTDGADPVITDGNATGDLSYSHQNYIPRRSLFERNNTAHTLEWEDSIDNSPEGPSERMKLPSPKRLPISPLKKYENSNKITRRRKIKRWSNLEEDTLRMGVQKYGKGNWKLILGAYGDIFEERTEVDLKDKWRNMTR